MQYRSYEDYMRDFLGYKHQDGDINEIPDNTYNQILDRSESNGQLEKVGNETRAENRDLYNEVYSRVAPLISDVTERTIENVTDYIIYEVRKKLNTENRNSNIEEIQENREFKEENINDKNINDPIISKRDIRNIEQDVRKSNNCNNKPQNLNNNYMNRYRKF